MAASVDEDTPLNKTIAIFWAFLILYFVLVFVSPTLSADI